VLSEPRETALRGVNPLDAAGDDAHTGRHDR